jgi:hypothetical protein
MIVYNIEWDTDGFEIDLPTEVDVPDNIDINDIADYLSDEYGFLVEEFDIEFDDDYDDGDSDDYD